MTKPHLTPRQLQRAMQSAAACDAALSDEDWLRTFFYEPRWQDGVAMAKFDNGSGDHVFVLFADDGMAVMKGFDHESEISPHAREVYAVWPGLYDGLPAQLMQLLQDESVEHEDVTFCFWSSNGETWQSGQAELEEGMQDGSNWLLPMLQMHAEEFIAWAQTNYEDDFEQLGAAGVRKIFAE